MSIDLQAYEDAKQSIKVLECDECKKIIPKKTKAWHHDMGIAKCDGVLCSEECATIWSRDYVPSRY